MSKKILVLGAGGFIGSHLVKHLKFEGNYVRSADLKFPVFSGAKADDFLIGDLRDMHFCREVINQPFDEVYQLAADMGGAGYIFTGENDADVITNSVSINLNVLTTCQRRNIKRVFYSSSACMYPSHNQEDPLNPRCSEDSAYPANPDSEYGWEKLFSERMYLAFNRNYQMQNRVARYHNIFGPEGTFQGGKEKAPAALCRKVALANNNDSIEVWGPGNQTRSFLYIDDCIKGSLAVMRSSEEGPYNIGSEEMVSINQLAELVISISNKKISINNVPGPVGVNGRNSDNNKVRKDIGWDATINLREGIQSTYQWIVSQTQKN